ncbi:MAG: MFS transporter [Thainema sp.]
MFKLITLLLTSSLTVMAGATLAPALPQIEAFFADEPNAAFWVKLMLTMPALFSAIGAPLSGAIADWLGRKPLLLGAAILYGLAGSSGLVLSSITGLLIGRALLGFAVAGVMTASTALIADYYHGAERNHIMGVQSAFMGFGGVVFLVLGGVLADVDWRFPFAIYLTALVAAVMVALSIHEPTREKAHENLKAKRDQAAALLDSSAQKETTAVFGRFKPSFSGEASFVPVLMGIYLQVFVFMAVFYIVPVQLPFYLNTLSAGISNTATGIAIASLELACAIFSLYYRPMKQRFSFSQILAIGFLSFGVGYLIVAIAQSYAVVLIGLIIAGIGFGVLIPNANVWLNAITPTAARGRAVGGLSTSVFLGQFFSPILSQPLIQQTGSGATYGLVGIGMSAIAIMVLVSTQIYNPDRSR